MIENPKSLTEQLLNLVERIGTEMRVLLNTANSKLGKTEKAASASTADKLTTVRTISLTGDATGSKSFDGSANAPIQVTLANSGATAGTYGPTAAATLAFGGSFNVPSITVDAKGRATKAEHFALKLPAAPSSVTGNAGSATKLATARTFLTNLGSTTAGSFDGTKNITLGVSGTLGIDHGGTGRTDGLAVNVVNRFSLSAADNIGYGSNNDWLIDKSVLAWWNGAYGETNKSNLTYCVNGSIVGTLGNQTIGGTKTFSEQIVASKGVKGTLTGNASTATTLATARTIKLTGAVTGSASFNGSADASIATTYTAMRGATSSAAGAIGAVPAPAAGANGKYLRGDGTWQTPPDTKYSNMTGADADTAGRAGLVPAPAAGAQTKYLRGDGTWQTPPNTTYSNMTGASSSAAGRAGLVPAPAAGNEDDYLMGNGRWGKPTSVSGNAGSATKLATARTFICNLESTSTGSFNGTANVTLGVSGELPIARGGTGRNDGHAPLDILMSGNRGNLAGYEALNSTSAALTVTNTTRDSSCVTGAVTITVSNGASGQTYTKTVGITNASAKVSLGSSWQWVGGTAPTISANGVLVLHWCGTFGIANFVAKE